MDNKEMLVDILNRKICPRVGADPAEVVADHLIDNGVIALPCKIGDTVWGIRNYKGIEKAQEGKVYEMYFLPNMSLSVKVKHICRGEFGKRIFKTKEEAEAAIAK